MIGDAILHGGMRPVTLGLLLVLAAGSGSCGDGLAPGGPDPAPVAVVSDPTLAAYVSLAPGTYPTGKSATISNPRTGVGLRVGLVEGGLDPLPIAADAGDMLDFAVDTGFVEPVKFHQLVPVMMRPRVVRTSPAPRKRDVSLNVRIQIVFSEPMDPATITSATLVLQRAGSQVEGEINLSANGLQATFQPSADLLAGTEYRLVLRSGIRDLGGSELAASPPVDFTTVTSSTGSVGGIEVTVSTSGTDVDGEYRAWLDGRTPFPVVVVYPTLPDGPAFLPGLPAGGYVVSIIPPSNCTVEGGPRSVTLAAGDLTRVVFSATCVPFIGTVRITAPTTGSVPGSTRYRVMHGSSNAWSYGSTPDENLGTMEPNDTLVVQTPMDKWGGIYWHSFELADVPAGCLAQRINPPADDPNIWGDRLTFGDTLDVGFAVTCTSLAAQPARGPRP
jgi:hypothetical protein